MFLKRCHAAECLGKWIKTVYSKTPPLSTRERDGARLPGAWDLYYALDAIPQAYVDHCAETGSGDIMYKVNPGASIRETFTDLCAYYVGLTDTCAEVETWGLARSTHCPPATDEISDREAAPRRN